MKKILVILIIFNIISNLFAQVDTISTNIYQVDRKLGIGTSNPNTWLTVVNDTNIIEYNRFTGLADFSRKFNNSVARFQIYGYPNTGEVLEHLRGSIMLYSTTDAKDFILCSNHDEGTIRFFTRSWELAESEKMRITSNGNIGIGTKDPQTKLQVADGDIFISDINKGIIMKSPDGQCWKGVLDNNGMLIFSIIDCPDGNFNKKSEIEMNNSIQLFPNPSRDFITLNIKNIEDKKVKYSIFNENGKLVTNGKITMDKQNIDVKSLIPGIYFIQIYNKKQAIIYNQKFVKE